MMINKSVGPDPRQHKPFEQLDTEERQGLGLGTMASTAAEMMRRKEENKESRRFELVKQILHDLMVIKSDSNILNLKAGRDVKMNIDELIPLSVRLADLVLKEMKDREKALA